MRPLTTIASVLVLLASQMVGMAPVRAAGPTWRYFAPAPRSPFLPEALSTAVDTRGNIYVVLAGLHLVQKISPTGQPLLQIGAAVLQQPRGVAVDNQGNIYVTEDKAIGLRKFSATGTLLGSVQTGRAVGVGTDNRGHVYVTVNTNKNPLLLKLGTGLKQLARYELRIRKNFGVPNAGPGQAPLVGIGAGPVAVTPSGDVYAVLSAAFDLGAKAGGIVQPVIQKLTPAGALQVEWFPPGSHLGLTGLAVGRSGEIVATDAESHQLLVYASPGHLRGRWGTEGCGAGKYGAPVGVAAAPDGSFYVVDSDNQNLHHLSAAGKDLQVFAGCPSQELNAPWGVAVDTAGNAYVGDFDHSRVTKFAPSGAVLARWSAGKNPRGVAVDAQGNVYVATDNATSTAREVLELSPSGKVVATFGKTQGLKYPTDVAVDVAGTIYIADDSSHILKISSAGKLLATWGGHGAKPGQFSRPEGLGLDAQGNLYVADYNNHRIQKLSPGGTVLATWQTFGAGKQLGSPQDVAVDHQGNVWVSDYSDNRVVELSSNGAWLGVFGHEGSLSPGQLRNPQGIAVDSQGNVYVADSLNNVIQELLPNG